MFDFRYHALSLAAVLIALAVGLLLGVAIGDANLVSNAEKRVINSLQGDIHQARNDAAGVRSQLAFRSDYERAVYPQLVGGELNGKRIGVIFLGQPSNQVTGLVRAALEPTGAQLVLVAVIRDPVNASSLASAAAGNPRYAALGTDPTLMNPFGARIGIQLVLGGRLLTQVQPRLFSYNGLIEPLGGVVIVRAPSPVAPDAQATNSAFEDGFASGLAKTGVPVVGVETSSTNPSQVPWYTQMNFSSVDDMEDLAGSTALVDSLAGVHGVFGSKPTASAVLPPTVGGRRP